MEEISEKDWKLFRERLKIWRSNYIKRLLDEYIELLSSSKRSEDKFWALEKRIRHDKRKSGVIVEMRRSRMFNNLFSLIDEGVITIDDLDGFSDNLIDSLKECIEIL